MLQNPRSKLAAWSRLHKDVLAASHESCTSRVILVNISFRFLIFFYDRICFSIEIPFQKCAGCHTSCEQQKSYGKNPARDNLYGNWCVRKGLILINLGRSKTARRRPCLIRLMQVWSMMSPVSFTDPSCTYVKIKVLLVIRLLYQEVGDARLAGSAKWQRVTSLEGCTPTDHESTLWLLVQYFHGNFSVCWKEE